MKRFALLGALALLLPGCLTPRDHFEVLTTNRDDVSHDVHVRIDAENGTTLLDKVVPTPAHGSVTLANFTGEGRYTVTAQAESNATASKAVSFSRRSGPDGVTIEVFGGAIQILTPVA